MRTSLFDLFKIGIGPSSSHTVGPMRAALRFTASLRAMHALEQTHRVACDLYGSLALTGRGHGTDRAVLLALSGAKPDQVDPATIDTTIAQIREQHRLALGGTHALAFDEATDLRFHRDIMFPPDPEATAPENPARHPNGMIFTAFDDAGAVLLSQTYYSIGGGFVVSDRELADSTNDTPARADDLAVPYPFSSAAELLATAAEQKLTVAQLMLANETALKVKPAEAHDSERHDLEGHDSERHDSERHDSEGHDFSRAAKVTKEEGALAPEAQVRQGIAKLWQAMQDCCQRGMVTPGILPGGLNVRRRAPRLIERLHQKAAALDARSHAPDPLAPLDWVSIYAIAVNEENAAGGRLVTAPTNGAAGVIPAVLHYYVNFLAPQPEQNSELWPSDAAQDSPAAGIERFFLTAAAIGILYKENASISGAEVGCQGEVGVACSMAAGGLVAALNGSNDEVEHAAEIAMEHNLGMTCDPIGGLVQIPCIERNAIGAVKAVQACRIAMNETEGHKVSLDQVIETMYRTGLDMQSRYKETSLAGLALNVIEC
jgi:L-serine dehydratase